MVKNNFVPTSGDIVWVDLNPTRGHEQSKLRSALVVTSRNYNQKTSLALMCPITSQTKGYPFEVVVKSKKINGVILADQIRSLDWRVRKVTFVSKVSTATLNTVRQKLSMLIGH